MFEAGVQVVLEPEGQDHLEVRVVDMGVYSEQSFEDGLYHSQEILGKGDA